ncbi:hypothetical protein LINPERHAP2_LOCUS10349 [Linum perenne]
MADDAQGMEERLRQLAILEEEDEIEVPEELPDVPRESFELCVVGTFVTDKNINFNAMKTQLANLWKPGRGISIEDRGEGLYLFRFYHHIDLRLVIEGGPWTFDGHLLTMHELKEGEDLTSVPLYEADFWVQVHGLTSEFYSELVGKALGNFLGHFVAYDEYNKYSAERSYMRIRVKLDVRRALKREKEVKKPSRTITVEFKYERLPTFCYLCGRIGHIDRFCELRFRIPESEIVLLWGEDMRASSRRMKPEVYSPWLKSPVIAGKEGVGRSRGSRGLGWGAGRSRPANIQALAVNFRASPEFKDKLVPLVDAGAVGGEKAIEVGEERKRRRGSESGDQPMDVDKENRFYDVNNGRQVPKNLAQAGSGSETCPPQ